MKEKMCRHCGTKEDLRTNKNGVIYNCCRHCYETIEVPDQIRKANESIVAKYGVSDLGELRQKRSKDTPPKQKEKKIITCKYCGTTENLVVTITKKRTISFHACKEHWEQYQKDKYEVRKKSNKEKFGVEQPLQNNDIKSKFKQTINSKSSEEKNSINKKREQTNLDKFGVTNPNKLKEFSDKRKSTLLEKYGVSHPMESAEFRERQKKTLLKNFGVDNPLKSKEIRDRVKKTNLEKRGVEYPSQSLEVQNKVRKAKRIVYWDIFVILLKQKNTLPLFTKEEYIDATGELTYKCLKCNSVFKSEGTAPQRITCSCYHRKSLYEYEIEDWLRSLNIENIKPNERLFEKGEGNFEIDVYLPNYNLGIDFNGLYWHSNVYQRSTYHREKYIFFKKKNISFIQIFESDWLSNKDVVKSIILNKLSSSEKIQARKCTVSDVPEKDYMRFLSEHHLQGYASASIKLGLFFNNELVFVMSFGKPRFSEKKGFEIIRSCSKKGYLIIGGFDKLLSYFENTYAPEKLISFIDVRYFNGNSYKASGFILEHHTDPNYYYFDPKNPTALFSRIAFQKHKLAGKLKVFDPALSESENMYLNGYLKIYDAGNLKMVKNY